MEQLKKMELAMRITRMRDMLGLSQEAMAEKTGVSLKEYRAYEEGRQDMTLAFLSSCAHVLEVEVEELYTGNRMRMAREGRGATLRQKNQQQGGRRRNLTILPEKVSC